MEHDEHAKVVAEANQQLARAKRLIEERRQSLRDRGIDPDELRASAEAAMRANPEMKRRVDEAMAQFQRNFEQSTAHEGFYAAPSGRRKAPKSMV